MGRVWLLPVALTLVLGAKLLLIVTCEGSVTGLAWPTPSWWGNASRPGSC